MNHITSLEKEHGRRAVKGSITRSFTVLILVSIVFLCLFTVPVMAAQCTISPTNENATTTDETPVGNSFTACQTGLLSTIRVLGVSDFSGKTLTIYSGEGIAGSILGTVSGISLSKATNPTTWSSIDVSSANITLTNNSKYTFYFTTPVSLYRAGEDNVTGGNMYQYIAGALQNMTSDDLRFEVDIVAGASNAAPTATAPSAPSVTEDDTNVALANDIQVTDTDGDDQTVTFNITGGTLTTGTTGITFGGGGNGSSSFTAAGTLSDINAALDAATFTPTPNLSGTNAATISFTTNDGTVSSSAASVSFDITAVNDEPTLTATGTNSTFTEDGSAAVVFSSASASTVESGQTLSAFTMTITNVNDGSSEILNLDGTAIVLTHGTSGTTATNSLSYSVSVSGTTATLSLSGGTLSTSAFQTLINAISYQNNSNTPNTSNRVVTLTSLTDSGSNSGSNDNIAALDVQSILTLVAVNDEPTLTGTGDDPTFTEGGAAASLFSSASAYTVESGQTLSGFTLTVTNVNNGSNEILNTDGTAITLTHGTSGTTATNSLSYSVSVSGTTATISLSGGTMSTSDLQTLLDAIAYQNNSNDPNTSNRVITVTSLSDSGGTANGGDDTAALSIASTLSIVSVNDEPTFTATGTNPTFTEGGSAAAVFSSASASTVESGQTLSAFTMTVTNVNDGSSEILNLDGTAIVLTHGTSGTTATNSLSYSVSVSGTTATLSLSGGTLSTSAFQTLINAISYQNNSNTPNTSNRVVTLTSLTDSGGTANSGDDTVALSIASTVTVVENNALPNLTDFASVVETTTQNNEVEITLSELKAQGNEADVDGTVDAFIVKALTTGTLNIGANSGAATSFNAITNKTIDASNNAYWTPSNNVIGLQNAFTTTVLDNNSAESAGAVQATVTVNDDANPEVSSINLSGSPASTATSITYIVTFTESVVNVSTDDFSLTKGGMANGTITSVSASSGTSINVIVNGISGTGALRLDLNASTNIADTSANTPPAAYTSGAVHTVDRDNPTLSSSVPMDGATGFSASANIILTFNENIVFGTGNIQIIDLDDGSSTVIINATSPGALASISTNTLTLNPASNLEENTNYAVQLATTAIDDSNGNSYSGILDNTTLNFTVANDSNESSTKGDSSPTTGVDILVNGVVETAATSTTTTVDNKTVTTITLDDKKLEEKLKKEGNNFVVTIPFKNDSDVAIGQLTGQTVKNMESKEAVLEIKTENVTYTLPASEININNISSQIGDQVELKDIKVNVRIASSSQQTTQIVQDTANRNSYQIVVKPVDFEITCTSGNKTVEVSKFNGYVERTVAIPDGIDPSKITTITGIVLNKDGTFSHVPTTIIKIDGKYYAKINSLTNSAYSVIWNEKGFDDVSNHWAKDAINDMGSRLVIGGVGDNMFEPDRDITRAEYAKIVVNALGLMKPGTGKDLFNDVTESAWYYDAIYIANEYGLISGYGNGAFGPDDKITREQAMAIISRAMQMTKINVDLGNDEVDQILGSFNDSEQVTTWAKKGVASCVQIGIVSGKGDKTLAPQDKITRAEVAAIVRRLLQKSSLI